MPADASRRQFLARAAGGAATIAAGSATVRIAPAHSADDHRLDAARQLIDAGRRQLFLDDVMIERRAGVRRVLHQPVKHEGNPILRQGQTAWNEYRTQLYGTVLYDPHERRFKMWYLSGARLPLRSPIMLDGRKRIPNFQLVGYAESEDGFRWKLPHLGLVDYNGSTDNNICRIARTNVEGIAVVHEDNAAPDRRYKALYWEHSANEPEPAPGINGMSVSFSRDGTSWTQPPQNPVMPFGSDTGQQAVWDEVLQRYVAFGRFNAGGRKVARAESRDFVNWSTPVRVFDADSSDLPGTQIYGMGVSRYEGVYLGMPWMFHANSTHRIDVQLATSRDGRQWTRVADRGVFLQNGPEGSWDAGLVFTASQPAQVKQDRIFIYYSASSHNHDYAYLHADPARKGTPEWFAQIKNVGTSIGVATLRRDGFVSLDAGASTGEVVTRPFRWPGGTAALHVNLNAARGSCAVDVLNADGLRIESVETRALRGDRLDTVAVAAASARELAEREVRLRFRLRAASLYSWWIARQT